MFDQSIDFERTRLCNLFDFVCWFIEWMRVVVIHIFIRVWMKTADEYGITLTSYIYITAATSINCILSLSLSLSLSQANHYYLVDKILLSPCQTCLLSQPTHPRYPPVNSNGCLEHICHKTCLSIYLLPTCLCVHLDFCLPTTYHHLSRERERDKQRTMVDFYCHVRLPEDNLLITGNQWLLPCAGNSSCLTGNGLAAVGSSSWWPCKAPTRNPGSFR